PRGMPPAGGRGRGGQLPPRRPITSPIDAQPARGRVAWRSARRGANGLARERGRALPAAHALRQAPAWTSPFADGLAQRLRKVGQSPATSSGSGGLLALSSCLSCSQRPAPSARLGDA